MSKCSSSTQAAPIASCTTRWRKRSYFSSLSCTRSHSASYVMPGRSSQTPTIIIRLTSLSMRSQAVSTRDMRWVADGIGFTPAFRMTGRPRCWVTCGPSIDTFTVSRGENAMSDLKSRFEQAVVDSKKLPEKPDNMTLLKLYALYKQASEGDVDGKRPGFSDMVGRAKWDAWNEAKGKSKDDAMQEY